MLSRLITILKMREFSKVLPLTMHVYMSVAWLLSSSSGTKSCAAVWSPFSKSSGTLFDVYIKM